MLPVELGEPSLHRTLYNDQEIENSIKRELDLVEETKVMARVRIEAKKQRA